MSKPSTLVQVPSASSEGLQKLQQIVNDQIGVDDLKDIVAKFVTKAKNGDTAAARFVVDYLLGAKHTPTAVTVNQFFDGEGECHRQTVGTAGRQATPEQAVSVYLSAAGEATAKTIAADTGLNLQDVVAVLDQRPDRFLARGDRYSLHKAV